MHIYHQDNAIRASHQDFGGRVLPGESARQSISDQWLEGGILQGDEAACLAEPLAWHGTHVAGTIGGSTYGVAKRVTMYAVQVNDSDVEAMNPRYAMPTSSITVRIIWGCPERRWRIVQVWVSTTM